MNSKKFAIGILIFCMGFMTSCASDIQAEQDKPLKIFVENRDGQIETYRVVDSETGVNYIVVSAKYNNGYPNEGVAVTPRLKADGSLYISR